MRLRRSYLLALLLLLSVSSATSADKIDDFVRSEMDRQHLPASGQEFLTLAVDGREVNRAKKVN